MISVFLGQAKLSNYRNLFTCADGVLGSCGFLVIYFTSNFGLVVYTEVKSCDSLFRKSF